MTSDDQRLMTTKEAADFLGCSERFLEGLRAKGEGPRCLRMSDKMIRYFKKDLIDWCAQCAVEKPN